MNLKNSLYLVAIINLFEGILGFVKGEIYIRHWHEVSRIESLLWIISSILIFLFAKKLKHKTEYTKCPKCEEIYYYSNLKEGICPKCNVKTVDIEEYYEK